MGFTFFSASVYIFACIAYGISSACVKMGLLHFSPVVLIFYRMFFGLIPCLIGLTYTFFTDLEFRMRWRHYMFPGAWNLFHICAAGFLWLGVTYPCIGIALMWVPSHAEQIMHPIAAMVGAIVSHFIFPDERFNLFKFFSIVIATVGLVGVVYPTLDHPAPQCTEFQMFLGYGLIFFAVVVFGITSVYMKMKTINFHPHVVTTYQMLVSVIFQLIVSSIFVGPKKLWEETKTASLYNWIWPAAVGIIGTGLAQLAANYLVANVGATAVAFTGIGQVAFGVDRKSVV